MLRKEFKEFVYFEEWETQHTAVIEKIGKSISENYGFSGMQQVYRGYAETLPNGLGLKRVFQVKYGMVLVVGSGKC
jgi:hypothetical protein